MSKFHFTTVLSSAYLFKGLGMYQTLKRHCSDFKLFILCADDECYRIIQDMKLADIELLRVRQIENVIIREAKNNRSYLEFCWTLKPAALYYVMKHYRNAEYYAHLDADLYFFSDPAVLFVEAPGADLYLVDHNNSEEFLHTYETSGRFNTGFVGCRNSDTARNAVKWWRDRCVKQCPSIPDPINKLFGDQRYVERWLELFEGVHVIENKGANVAVWNIRGYNISSKNDEVYVDNSPLIFYHFSGFCILNENEFSLTWFQPIEENGLNLIYLPYMKLIQANIKDVQTRYSNFRGGLCERAKVSKIQLYKL